MVAEKPYPLIRFLIAMGYLFFRIKAQGGAERSAGRPGEQPGLEAVVILLPRFENVRV